LLVVVAVELVVIAHPLELLAGALLLNLQHHLVQTVLLFPSVLAVLPTTKEVHQALVPSQLLAEVEAHFKLTKPVESVALVVVVCYSILVQLHRVALELLMKVGLAVMALALVVAEAVELVVVQVLLVVMEQLLQVALVVLE
jgi:hypothetical protein